MNLYAVLQGSALLGYLFILGLVYGRARNDPVNRAFRLFLWCAFGWALTGFLLFLPQSVGHEILLKRAGALCWISINFWFLRFIYLLLRRKRDLAWYVLAVCMGVGCATYAFTDLAIEGVVRYEWGAAAIRGPLHSAIATVPAIAGGYALAVLARSMRQIRDPAFRKSIVLLFTGGLVSLVFAMFTNALIPVAFGRRGFPELGSYGVFFMCPFLYLAVIRHDFLSISVAEVAEKLFEDLRDGIVLVDQSGLITKMNPAAAAMLSQNAEPDGPRHLSELLPSYRPTHAADTGEFSLRRDGVERFISFSQSRSTKEGFDLGEVIVLRDVTEEKHTEEVLRRSRDELQAEVVRRTEELRHAQKMEAIGTLAGGIAHDFNNILAAIVGFATAAKEDLPEDHALRADMDEVLRASGRARDIVRQLLSFSRRKEPQKKTVDASAVVAESIKLLQASLPATIQVDYVPSHGRCAVVADPTQLQQVVLNLATNAYHAMEDRGGALRISVGRLPIDDDFADRHGPLRAGPCACIAVSDSGHGMTPEVLARIFDPFFTTKSADQGTGLGLATALRIAQEHGGTITVESTPSVGSTFRVYLPLADNDTLSDSYRDTTAPGGTERIMIVDDKAPVAAAMSRLLQPLGYRTTVFTDPERALAAVREDPTGFDLVITDQTMPAVTGVVLAERVKRIRPELPVLLVSGYPPPGDVTGGGKGPVGAFLPKPLEKASLARSVRKLLDGSNGPTGGTRGSPSPSSPGVNVITPPGRPN